MKASDIWNSKIRQAFWCFAIALMGSVSLAGMPSFSLPADWQEAMMVASSYQVEAADVEKEHVETADSYQEQKAKTLIGGQPKWVAPFVLLRVWNLGEDLHYFPGMVEYLGMFQDHWALPVGSMAPPAVM